MRPIIPKYTPQKPQPLIESERKRIEQTSCPQLETHSTPFLKLSDELVQHIFKKAVNKKELSSGDTISRVSKSWNSAMKEIAKIDSEYLPFFSDRLYLKQLGTTPKAFGCRLQKVIEQSQSVDIFRGEVKSGKEFRSISFCYPCNEDSESNDFEPWDSVTVYGW